MDKNVATNENFFFFWESTNENLKRIKMIKMKLKKKNENENSPNLKYVIYILPFSYIFLSYWSFQDKNLRHLFAHDSIFKSILGVGSVS